MTEVSSVRGLTYISEKPCKRGHTPERYVSNHKCVECSRLYKQITHKTCRHCGKVFEVAPMTVQRLYCNDSCKYAAIDAKYHEKKKTKYAQRIKRRDYIRKYKLERGCETCGYKAHPAALQLDHIEPSEKFKTLSQLLSYSWTAMLEELKKCRVLCANCHSIHTHNQMAEGKLGERFKTEKYVAPEEVTEEIREKGEEECQVPQVMSEIMIKSEEPR